MSLTGAQWLALAPLILLASTAIAAVIVIAYGRREWSLAVTSLGLAVTIILLPAAAQVVPLSVTPLLTIDGSALLFMGLFAGTTLAVLGLANGYFRALTETHGELVILLATAVLGGALLAASVHLAAFLLGFELISISLLALLAYLREERIGLEAGMKYLVLSGTASAFLLFGIALVYYEAGSLGFAGLAATSSAGTFGALFAAGTVMLLAGAAFKLSQVPFHLWTPDVYQGAPAPVTAFLATVSKAAVFVVLLRYIEMSGTTEIAAQQIVLSMLAVASILLGNILALLQQNLKRLLAYSSIAHIGYLLIALVAPGPDGQETAGYYLVTYMASNLGAFGVIAVLSSRERGEPERVEDYRGLFWRQPWLATVLALMLLSLAGIPLTMGFVAKFYVVTLSISASQWWLLGAIVVGSAIGLYYYLRVLVVLFLDPAPAAEEWHALGVPLAGRAVLAIVTGVVLGFGLFPEPLIVLLRSAATTSS